MGVTNYYSLGGEIIGERTGAIRTDYSRDALGSVTATRTDVPAKDTYDATYRYKPYGARLAKTGTAPDPDFQWVGTAGYRESSISHSQSYVRARQYGQQEGRWTTLDPLWPSQLPYIYSRDNPASFIDHTGLFVEVGSGCEGTKCVGGKAVHMPPGSGPLNQPTRAACKKITDCFNNPNCRDEAVRCIGQTYKDAGAMLRCLYHKCNSKNMEARVKCGGELCFLNVCAHTYPGSCTLNICMKRRHEFCNRCQLPDSVAIWWVPGCQAEFGLAPEITIIHEMTHCCGNPSSPDKGDDIALCIWT